MNRRVCVSARISPPREDEVTVTWTEADHVDIRVRDVTFCFTRNERGSFPVGAPALVPAGEVHEVWLRAARELAAERLDSILKGHAPRRDPAPTKCPECGGLLILPDRAPARVQDVTCGPDHGVTYDDGVSATLTPGMAPVFWGPDGQPLPTS